MVVWGIALTVICIAAWWFYTRRLTWQFTHIESRLKKMNNERQGCARADKAIMRKLYKMLQASLKAGNEAESYRALDLLKLALGHGLGRTGEASRLTAIIYLALHTKQLDAAGHSIDAFRPLLKNTSAAELPAAIEQLGLIAVICLKQRQNFLAARAVDIVFYCTSNQDPLVQAAIARALRLTGLTALRRKDIGLIRELQAKMSNWLADEPADSRLHEHIAGVLAAWLHRAVKVEDFSVFELIAEYCSQLAEKKLLTEQGLADIIVECAHLSSMDSLNPYSKLSGKISMFSLELAVEIKSIVIWRQALGGVMQAARGAVNQRSLGESFAIIYPLLEMGRRLLAAELAASPREDVFRQEALFILIRECLQLVDFVARQNFTTSIADIIEQIYQAWIKYEQNQGLHKSIKRLCQLLFQYCTRIKRRQKNIPREEDGFNAENVISLKDREHLEKLGYLY